MLNWYLGIWRGEHAPLGRIPKAAERFEAAQWLSDRGWGRPPKYVDLVVASTEVKRIEVTFEAMPIDGNGEEASMVVDVTPAPHNGQRTEQSESASRPELPAPPASDN